MLQQIKDIFSIIARPFIWLKNQIVWLLSPFTRVVSVWTQPLRDRFNVHWLPFASKYPRWAYCSRFLARTVAVFYALNFVFWTGLFGEIPSVSDLKNMQALNASELLDESGRLIDYFYKDNRHDIEFKDISPYLINGLVATEDKRFYEHHGVDYISWARVFFRTILKGDESGGGGSTLSQQLAKNLYPRQKFWFFSSVIFKFREVMIARNIEKAFDGDKEGLIAFYYNTVPFGGNLTGVHMASKRFFNKKPIDLKPEEAAVLVGMLKANTTYNPILHSDRSIIRRNTVLQNMVAFGSMTQKDCDKLKVLPLKTDYNPKSESRLAPYFREYVRKNELPEILSQCSKSNGKAYDMYRDGLKIYTTLDSSMQEYAESAVRENMTRIQASFQEHWAGQNPWGEDKVIDNAMKSSNRYLRMADDRVSKKEIIKAFNTKMPMRLFNWGANEQMAMMSPLDSIKHYYAMMYTGFMAMDPHTGKIKAWVGGNDYDYMQYDHVRSRRQVGSTFKPIVYANAIRKGQKPCDYISNRRVSYGNWEPKNADGNYGGSYSMEGALTNSVNVVSVQLIQKHGVESTRALAKEMGVSNEIPKDATIALGTADISLFDMMKVYGTIANRGKRPEPIGIAKIADRDGKIIWETAKADIAKQPQVLKPEEADMMVKMMKSVVDEGTAGRLRWKYGISGDIAGKTGTTQSYADGWFMGFTPNLVVGAWVGGESPAVRFRDFSLGQGAATALPTCGLFLQKLYNDPRYGNIKTDKFPTPPKWILDSMECAHRIYSEDEQAMQDSMRLNDSINMVERNLGVQLIDTANAGKNKPELKPAPNKPVDLKQILNEAEPNGPPLPGAPKKPVPAKTPVPAPGPRTVPPTGLPRNAPPKGDGNNGQ
jgi:penicillin-binding protein 1A